MKQSCARPQIKQFSRAFYVFCTVIGVYWSGLWQMALALKWGEGEVW